MKRRRRRPIQKPEQYKQARFYVSRGYPLTFVAEKVRVSRATVQTWCRGWASKQRVRSIVRRIMALPVDQRKQVIEAVRA